MINGLAQYHVQTGWHCLCLRQYIQNIISRLPVCEQMILMVLDVWGAR